MIDIGNRRLGRGRRFALGALLVAAAACGGGGGGTTPNTPTTPTTPTPAPTGSPAAAVTITITSAGVSPSQVEVPVGGRVTFVNNDSAFHEMSSDPHPIHTDCPEINSVGALGPGTTRQTAAFTRARTCGFHDHGQENNTSLQGQIVIR
jgi:plastocyanin